MRLLAVAMVVILSGCAAPSGDHAAHVHQPAKASAEHAKMLVGNWLNSRRAETNFYAFGLQGTP